MLMPSRTLHLRNVMVLEARVASIDSRGSSSTRMDCEGRAVPSSTTETSRKCPGPKQLFPGFPNGCSESGVLQPVQRRVLPMTNREKQHEKGEKLHEKEKQCDRFESDRN